jgi:predicted Rossmann fold nucleotide-binding protein DprA/Smf involved in DNA uptake
VTDPADVLAILETPARHHHVGTHEHRYRVEPAADEDLFHVESITRDDGADVTAPHHGATSLPLSAAQQAIMSALCEPLTMDELIKMTGLSVSAVRSEVTMLEIQRRIVRKGAHLARP